MNIAKMKDDKPLILISNDDGFEAKGIRELVRFLRPLGQLVVMAPDGPRSGMSCAITSDRPVTYSQFANEEGFSAYKCSGTPVDCIKLASTEILCRQPDLIIGGINHGDNSAINVHYSGTMGIVIEGCLRGIPSIGFSLCDHAADADFSPLERPICQIVSHVWQCGLPESVCLNVNFPLAASFKGIRVCRQARGRWMNEWEKRQRPPHGKDYFWLTGNFVGEDMQEDTDRWALKEGYVAVTPISIDMTASAAMEELKERISE